MDKELIKKVSAIHSVDEMDFALTATAALVFLRDAGIITQKEAVALSRDRVSQSLAFTMYAFTQSNIKEHGITEKLKSLVQSNKS